MSAILAAIAFKSAKRQPMQTLDRGIVSPEAGLAGDARGRPSKRQLTILFAEDWARAVAGLDPAAAWTIRRANLLVSGLANPMRAGGILMIGDCRLQITGETEPCRRMDEQLPGLQESLKADWRGGLTARVITGGVIAVGDDVNWT